jgi:hypothetical protein
MLQLCRDNPVAAEKRKCLRNLSPEATFSQIHSPQGRGCSLTRQTPRGCRKEPKGGNGSVGYTIDFEKVYGYTNIWIHIIIAKCSKTDGGRESFGVQKKT